MITDLEYHETLKSRLRPAMNLAAKLSGQRLDTAKSVSGAEMIGGQVLYLVSEGQWNDDSARFRFLIQ